MLSHGRFSKFCRTVLVDLWLQLPDSTKKFPTISFARLSRQDSHFVTNSISHFTQVLRYVLSAYYFLGINLEAKTALVNIVAHPPQAQQLHLVAQLFLTVSGDSMIAYSPLRRPGLVGVVGAVARPVIARRAEGEANWPVAEWSGPAGEHRGAECVAGAGVAAEQVVMPLGRLEPLLNSTSVAMLSTTAVPGPAGPRSPPAAPGHTPRSPCRVAEAACPGTTDPGAPTSWIASV